MFTAVVVWLASCLVLSPNGPSVQSGIFDTEAECLEAQARVAAMADVLAVSECVQVTFRPAGPDA